MGHPTKSLFAFFPAHEIQRFPKPMVSPRKSRGRSLEALVATLGVPADPLVSRRDGGALVLPENIICFQHDSASNLNQPRHGRALHHRLVLIFALRTAVTVCVDDRSLRLHAGEGLLVLPFQFHHYIDPEQEKLRWLFVTFEVADPSLLEPLRFRPFTLTDELRRLAGDFVETYLRQGQNDVLTLLFGLMLARVRLLKPARLTVPDAPDAPGIVTQVNLFAANAGEAPRVRELAAELGISVSHLRARFRASCGISLGRHLRRLRLEKARNLLRLSSERVKEIAEKCGFNSVYSFSRSFSAAFGISPRGYRNGGHGPASRVIRGKNPRKGSSKKQDGLH